MSVTHIAKRILLMLAGYMVAVLVGLVSIVALYAVLSRLPGAPSYFAVLGLTPLAVLAVPPLALFVYLMAIVVTWLQTLVFSLIAEFLALRPAWLHMLFGAVCATSGYALVEPGADLAGIAASWPDYVILAGAGLVAGLVYWLIAGRDAGFSRPAPIAA